MQYKDLIEFGREVRTTTSKRGAIIQLEGNTAYITNERASIVMKIDLSADLGTGTFYASEAPIEATRIQRRDGKVFFEIPRYGSSRYIYLPEKVLFGEKVEGVITSKFVEPSISLDGNIFSDVLPNVLITHLKVGDKTLELNQKRSDGSAEIGATFKIFDEGKGSMKFFTTDFILLSKLAQCKVAFGSDSLSVSAMLKGSKIVGLISALDQED